LDWNLLGTRKRRRPKQTEIGLFQKKHTNVAKHEMRLRGWQATHSDGDPLEMSYVPNGTTLYNNTIKKSVIL
jgi:hypothetical protein